MLRTSNASKHHGLATIIASNLTDTTENRDKLQIIRRETEEIGNVGSPGNADIDQGLMTVVILPHFVPKVVGMRLTLERTDTLRDTRRDSKIKVKGEITLTEKEEIIEVGHEIDRTDLQLVCSF